MNPELRSEFRSDARGRFHARASAKLRHLPSLLRAGRGLPSSASEYQRIVGDLYRAVDAVTGGALLVDASKSPGHALVMRGLPDVDLRVIHLVRDARGVAYAWSRRKPAPSGVAGQAMNQAGWLRTSCFWVLNNALTATLVKRSVGSSRYCRVKYEDLTEQPDAVVHQLAQFLGLVIHTWPFVTPSTAVLSPTHNAGGNPGRFDSGEIDIRPDVRWQSEMALGPKLAVTMASAAVLRAMGYRIRTKSSRRP